MSPETIVAWMGSIRGEVSVKLACELLGIARATYYRWKQPLSQSEKIYLPRRFVNFAQSINSVMATTRLDYCAASKRAIHQSQTSAANHQREGLQCRVRIKKRRPTGQPTQIAEHQLKRQFQANAPMQKLVTEITHLLFGGKMLYLLSILDLFNGEIVAYGIADKQDTAFVLDTLNQLPLTKGAVLHSDQGSVYTSQAYQKAVKGKGNTTSMSRKGTPADNAPIESFHSTLKSETFYLEGLTCTTAAIVEQTVRDCIYYYNSIRIQTKLNNQSPIDYRRLAV